MIEKTNPMMLRSIIWSVIAGLLLVGGSGEVRSQSNEECLTCHAEPSLTMEKRGKTVPLFVEAKAFGRSAHNALECVSCHEGFKPDDLPHARKITPVACLSCHGDDRFQTHAESIHGKPIAQGGAGLACAGCHTAHAVVRVSDAEPAARKLISDRMCAGCHAVIAAEFDRSDHGLALAASVAAAPGCTDCHTTHDVKATSDSGAATSRTKEAAMCLSCHLDREEVRSRVGPSAGFISSYSSSVHSRAMAEGNEAAATCTDCHGSHEMKKGVNPASRVSRQNIGATCGQCHGDVEAQYRESSHGVALGRGVAASATCTDCHGEHDILSPTDPRSPVAPRNVSAKVCSPCHSSLRLTQKYGLAGDRLQSFEDSYHGLAGRAGSQEVANCASCHGVHDIKSSADTTSRIHPNNLAATCGSCHPGAGVNFTRGSVHVVPTSGENELLYLVSTGYILLIGVIVGGMVVHNVADFVRKSKRRLLQRRGMLEHAKTGHRLYLRMSLSERIQHGALMLSFFTLVMTGFALRYPDAWWVAPVREISPAVFDLRSLLHRIAAVVMVTVSFYHVYYLTVVPRGKQLLRDLLPVRNDITEAIGVMKYNFGFARTKPQLGRFSYIEKAEYWALVWGTIVMAVTGVILWFDNTFMNLLTKLGWDVARTIHYYEAWLATLAIVVWHLYFVIFNPDTYPINLAFWKGTLTEEEMHEEHPAELAEILEREDRARRALNGEPGNEKGKGNAGEG